MSTASNRDEKKRGEGQKIFIEGKTVIKEL
jgi:hypothetical protein